MQARTEARFYFSEPPETPGKIIGLRLHIKDTTGSDQDVSFKRNRKDGWMMVGPMAPKDAAVIGPLRIPLQLGEATSSFVMNPDMAAANAKVEFIQAA
ncbi:hypothetical protein [Raineyella sp. W15-4]|uniref:hypothetical protein n=1 Tax=Raineyella sp. W15-4 TaxID=3081651 RepID=UPI002952DF14|nr:hypothetical protein [Raineyella sp. W15-4]WOQ18381.1 hypothetical protein R0145_06765 [Raineyella sp. W15-4]